MKPLKLEMCGIGPYKEKVFIDFEKAGKKGLFLITGPTGAGKTTIFDGIAFALFGDTSGTTREKDSLRSDFADEETDTYVVLNFKHKEKVYEIYRNPKYERPKKRGDGFTEKKEDACLKCDGEQLISGATQVTEKIREIIGIDYHQFKQISMIAQGEFTDLLINSSKDRTKIFRDIFGTGIYEKIRIMLSVKANQLKAEVKTINSKLEDAVNEIELDDGDEVKGKSYYEIIEKVKVSLLKMEKSQEEIKDEINKIQTQQDVLISLRSDLNIIKELRIKIEKLENEIKKLMVDSDKLELEYNDIAKQYENIPNIEQMLYKLNESLLENETYLGLIQEYIKENERLKIRTNEYVLAEESELKAKIEFEEMDNILRRAAIGIAARNLVEGEPCPVCGSRIHPDIAEVSHEIPDESHVKKLKEKYERLSRVSKEKHALAVSSKESLEMIKINTSDIERLEEYKEINRKIKNDIEENTKKCDNIRHTFNETKLSLERNRTVLEKSNENLINYKTELNEKIIRFDAYKDRDIYSELEEIKILRETKTNLKEKLSNKISINQKFLGLIADNLSKKDNLEDEYGIVSDLENIASGKNNRNLVFEQYVLSVYFDAILKAANQRLDKMTSGRYYLSRVKEAFSARSKDSLEIEVFDNYTGKLRSVKTLSGGEVFKAALSLAFGMSDVIQNFSGGVEINTLFIDEGFGALDAESLDQAIEALLGISSNERLIGIISHVQELKDRIKNQIVIEKTNSGSRIVQ